MSCADRFLTHTKNRLTRPDRKMSKHVIFTTLVMWSCEPPKVYFILLSFLIIFHLKKKFSKLLSLFGNKKEYQIL